MDKMVVVGSDNFEKLIKDNGYYIDKTELLYDLFDKTRNEVTLFTRPRRFGKTLTMTMMECFFDITSSISFSRSGYRCRALKDGRYDDRRGRKRQKTRQL